MEKRGYFADDGKTVVFDYYRKTGFFQPNHHVIVQNRILKEHPWVALELYDAFRRSKEIAYDRAGRLAGTLVYFPGLDIKEQRAVIGDNPFPLGLAAMGRNIERAIQGSVEQPAAAPFVTRGYIYYDTTLLTWVRAVAGWSRLGNFGPLAEKERALIKSGSGLASDRRASWVAG